MAVDDVEIDSLILITIGLSYYSLIFLWSEGGAAYNTKGMVKYLTASVWINDSPSPSKLASVTPIYRMARGRLSFTPVTLDMPYIHIFAPADCIPKHGTHTICTYIKLMQDSTWVVI